MVEKERRVSRTVRLETYNAFLMFFGVLGLVLVMIGAVGVIEKETFPVLKQLAKPLLIAGIILMIIGFTIGFRLSRILDKIQDRENRDHEDGLYKI